MTSLFDAFLAFVDGEINAGAEPRQSEAAAAPAAAALDDRKQQHSTNARRDDALDEFNDRVAEVHVLLAERRYLDARDAWRELHAATREETLRSSAGPAAISPERLDASSPSLVCPRCHRRIVSAALHSKTCTAVNASPPQPASSSPSSSAATNSPTGVGEPPPLQQQQQQLQSPATRVPASTLSPSQEIVENLRSKLAAAVLGELRRPDADARFARELWRVGVSLGDSRATDAFAAIVVRHFDDFANEVRQRMDAVRSLQRMGLEVAAAASIGNGDSGGGGGGGGRSYSPHQLPPSSFSLHPFLSCHRSALGHGTLLSDGHRDGSSTAPAHCSSDAPVDATSQVHVDSLASLLGEASSWMIAVMETPDLPHGARVHVAGALHTACAAAAVPVLHAYAEDTMLAVTVEVANSVLDSVERRAEPGVCVVNLEAAAAAASERSRESAHKRPSPPHDSAHPDGSGNGSSGGTRHHPQPQPRLPLPFWASLPLRIHFDAGVAIVDEASDQLSFLCQVLERFLRCVTVCLALGAGDQPSRVDSSPLSVAMHELQGQYVLLEHAYVSASTAIALRVDSGGWTPVSVHDDGSVLTFAWVDTAFFVMGKALARAAATCCDMAAAACVNYVGGCIDGALADAVRTCVSLAGERRDGGRTTTGGVSGSPSTAAAAAAAALERGGGGRHGRRDISGKRDCRDDDADLDDELSARFSSALLGPNAGGGNRSDSPMLHPAAAASSSYSSRAGGGGEPGSDSAAASAALLHSPPAASDRALIAVNTVTTVQKYTRALYRRTVTEFRGVFPVAAGDSSSSSSTRNASAAAGVAPAAPSLDGGQCVSEDEDDADLCFDANPPPLPLANNSAYANGGGGGSGRSSRQSPALRGIHSGLRGPLLELHCIAQESFEWSEAHAFASLAECIARDGLAALRQQCASSSYVLSEASYDALALHPPITATLKTYVIMGGGLSEALRRLLAPDCRNGVMRCIALLVARTLESGWFSFSNNSSSLPSRSARNVAAAGVAPAVNEWGALAMQTEAVSVLDELGGVLERALDADADSTTSSGGGGGGGGASGLRSAFNRLAQGIAVLNCQHVTKLDETFVWPVPVLSREDILALLRQRAGAFAVSQAALDAIPWERVLLA